MTRPHDRIAHELERLKAERARQDAELTRLTQDLDIDESEVSAFQHRLDAAIAEAERRKAAPKPFIHPAALRA